MFNGIYELLFGSNSVDDAAKENEGAPLAGKSADGWFLVEKCGEENEDPEESATRKPAEPRQPSEEELKRAAAKAAILAEKKRRQEVEELLLGEVHDTATLPYNDGIASSKVSALNKLTQPKVKRSKKSGKLNSNRSNNRKCNNIN
ncbi:hypothetical protein L596_014658 [Steinernema carpocapsae]|uniref:Uncharacterized protein n=1 Tax=Steinernema carpocapsae TaxID=34508 RepID=A0A4U5NCR4_STECR|nr:hypothetical protein L596_014658 [Steinernema carpocapsae]